MIPGSAIGSTTRNEIVSRPKNLKRETASDSQRPEHERDARRAEAACTESQSAPRTPSSCVRDPEPLRA